MLCQLIIKLDDVAEILLKVALNTINQIINQPNRIFINVSCVTKINYIMYNMQ